MNISRPTIAGRSRPKSQSWGRFVGIVVLFGLLGPLVGAIAVNGIFTLYAVGVEFAKGTFDDIARLFWGGMVVGTIFSIIIAYALGTVSALAVGVTTAICSRRKSEISWRTVFVAAFVFWLLTSLAATTVVPPEGLVQWVSALFIAHMAAVAICTWIARRIFR